jgi:UDP-glucose 4-epimerase
MVSLITGGLGFIGSHAVERLVALGEDVLVLDNQSTCGLQSHEYVARLTEEQDNLRVVKQDILYSFSHLLDDVNEVYHFAAVPRVPYSVEHPGKSIKANVMGTISVLEQCKEVGIKDIVISSSSSVYGDVPKENLPAKETTPLNPMSPYATSKACCEMFAQNFNELYDMNISCLRYFNVYGPRQDAFSEYSCVIPRFLSLASKGLPLNIYGDGKQTRDFTHVSDVIDANLLACGKRGTYNICSGNPITINELAKTIIEESFSTSAIKKIDKRAGDVYYSEGDCSLAKKELKWKPQQNLEESLRKLALA